MDWTSIFTPILGTILTAFGGTAVWALVNYLKNLKVIKQLGIESIIEKGAEMAVNYVEAIGRSMASTQKMDLAKKSLRATLIKKKIRLDDVEITKVLEATLNKNKETIEAWKSTSPDPTGEEK